MTERDMTWRLQAIGDAETAGAMNRVKKSMAGLNSETAKAEVAQVSAATATEALGKAAAETTKKTGAWKDKLTSLVGGLAAFSPAVGTAQTAATGFGAALGPVGIAIGVIISLAPSIVEAFKSMGDAAEEEGERMEAVARRIRATMDQLGDFNTAARESDMAALESRADDLAVAIFAAENRGDAIEARRARVELDALNAEIMFAPTPGDGGNQPAPRAAREERAEREGRSRGSSRGASGPEVDTEVVGVLTDILSELEGQQEDLEGEASMGRANTSKDSESLRGEAEFANAELMREREAIEERRIELLELQTEELEEQQRLLDEQVASAGEFADQLSFVGTLWSSTIKDVIEGEKTLGEALRDNFLIIMQQIGEQMIGEGFIKMFQGLFLAVQGNPQGAAMIGIGAAEIAVGTGLLAGGSAGAASVSAGGGGGEAPVPSAAGGEDSGGGGGTTIIQQINDPVDEARLGRIQEASARAAKRSYGGRI